VGAVYGPKVVTTVLIFLKYEGLKGLPYFLEITLASYASLALLMLFYPLSTFIADVYAGCFGQHSSCKAPLMESDHHIRP